MGDMRCFTPDLSTFRPPTREAASYLLALKARYVVARSPLVRGRAETQAISNRRVVIRAEHRLEPGEWVQLFIKWPARRDGVQKLHLVVGGEVMRSQDELAEIEIRDYDLRPDVM